MTKNLETKYNRHKIKNEKNSKGSIFRDSMKSVPYILALGFAIFIYRWIRVDEKSPPIIKLFAEQEKKYALLLQHVSCSSTYMKDTQLYPGCKPSSCGRYILDNAVLEEEIEGLLHMVKQGLSYGGSDGGASILDVYTGAMSKGEHFINVYKFAHIENLFKSYQIEIYKKICNRLLNIVADIFNIPSDSIFLTSPTFFSRFNNRAPLTVHDIYWSLRVDKIIYSSFHYTTLLYLNDFGKDFTGGQLNFLEVDNSSSVVEPRKGRVVIFTSGEENRHYTSEVTSGDHYKVTIAFTCDERKAIRSPFNNPYVGQ